MKASMTLERLTKKLKDDKALSRDYLMDTRNVEMSRLCNLVLDGNLKGVTPDAHSQLAYHLNIPKRYYDRMLTNSPELLASNVNRWMSGSERDEKPCIRMVRTMDIEGVSESR